MGFSTSIEWCHHSWNPWQGCTRTDNPGCANCYALADMQRFGKEPHQVIRSKPPTFNLPLSKKVQAGERVFVCSWSDFFHPAADPEWRREAWGIMRNRYDVTFIILTKRIQNVRQMLPPDWGAGWRNVWLGVSISNQETAFSSIPDLLQTPAAVRCVSAEPLLESVNLSMFMHPMLADPDDEIVRPALDWIIAGGESGPHARPMHPHWILNLLTRSLDESVPFFFKQWGEWSTVRTLNTWSEVASMVSVDQFRRGDVLLSHDGIMIASKQDHQLERLRDVVYPVAHMRRTGKHENGAMIAGQEYKAFPDVPDYRDPTQLPF